MLSRMNRAKQFLPFDAVSGLQKALREKEIEYVNKAELSEEQIEQISSILTMIKDGENIKVVYYVDNQYKEIYGKVKKVNTVKKSIIINDIEIFFTDIFTIKRRH